MLMLRILKILSTKSSRLDKINYSCSLKHFLNYIHSYALGLIEKTKIIKTLKLEINSLKKIREMNARTI